MMKIDLVAISKVPGPHGGSALSAYGRKLWMGLKAVQRRIIAAWAIGRPQLRTAPKRLTHWVGLKIRPSLVTITTDGPLIRIVVFSGKEVVAYTTVRARGRADGVPSPLGQEQAELESALSRLPRVLQALNLHRPRVVTGMPLSQSVLRSIELPPVDQGQAKEILEAELLASVPFEPGEIDHAFCVSSLNGRQLGFFIATPSDAVDRHFDQFRRHRARPLKTFAESVALAYASPASNGTVVFVGHRYSAIVVMRDRIPVLVRHAGPIGDGAHRGSIDELCRTVGTAVGHYRTRAGVESDEDLPTFIFGPRARDEVVRGCRDRLGNVVSPKVAGGSWTGLSVPVLEYAQNLGLAAAYLRAGRARDGRSFGSTASLSLLSARHMPRRTPVKMLLGLALLAVVGIAAVPVGNKVNSLGATADDLSRQALKLEATERAQWLTQRKTESAQLQARAQNQFTSGLGAFLDQLQEDVSGMIDNQKVLLDAGSGVHLSVADLTRLSDGYEVKGEADSYKAIFEYVSATRASGRFRAVEILHVDQDLDAKQGDTGTARLSFQLKASTS